MSLKFKRQQTKPVEFETIKVTAENYMEIAKHIGAERVVRTEELENSRSDIPNRVRNSIKFYMPARTGVGRERAFTVHVEEGHYLVIIPARNTFDYSGMPIHLFKSYTSVSKKELKNLADQIDGGRFEGE